MYLKKKNPIISCTSGTSFLNRHFQNVCQHKERYLASDTILLTFQLERYLEERVAWNQCAGVGGVAFFVNMM